MQDYRAKPIRSAAILTGSYVAGTTIGIDEIHVDLHNQLMLLVQFTKGSLTSAEIKVEFSCDDTTYYQETFGSISSGVSTLSLGNYTMDTTGNYRIPIPVKDRFIKVSAKGTGTATGSSMTIDAVIGTA